MPRHKRNPLSDPRPDAPNPLKHYIPPSAELIAHQVRKRVEAVGVMWLVKGREAVTEAVAELKEVEQDSANLYSNHEPGM